MTCCACMVSLYGDEDKLAKNVPNKNGVGLTRH